MSPRKQSEQLSAVNFKIARGGQLYYAVLPLQYAAENGEMDVDKLYVESLGLTPGVLSALQSLE